MTRWGGHEVGRISRSVWLAVAAAMVVGACAVAGVLLGLAPSDALMAAVRSDARAFGWPLVIGVVVGAYLALQHRAERDERKLADAPLDQGERLRFK